MQAFDHQALFDKSKVFIDRALACERSGDNSSFQLWCSLSLELLGKAVLAKIHPALVADPSNLPSLLAACGVPTKPERRSITFKTVFERLPHVCKEFRADDETFCMLVAARRNEELHSGALPYAGMRHTAWVSKFWKVSKTLLEELGKSFADWIDSEAAAKAEEWIDSAKTADMVEGKLREAKARFDAANPTDAAKKEAIAKKDFTRYTFSHFSNRHLLDCFQATVCPACQCEAALAGEEWHQETVPAGDRYEPWREMVETEYLSTAFYCLSCELRLDTREELTLANLPETFLTAEMQEPDYEADYGND